MEINLKTAVAAAALALGFTLPQAQGLALADKTAKNDRVTICVVSDGASMEGEAKEAFAAIPGLAAIAIGSDGPASLEVPDEASREARPFAIRRALVAPANGAVQAAFYIAVGPERDGAQATVAVLLKPV